MSSDEIVDILSGENMFGLVASGAANEAPEE